MRKDSIVGQKFRAEAQGVGRSTDLSLGDLVRSISSKASANFPTLSHPVNRIVLTQFFKVTKISVFVQYFIVFSYIVFI